MKQDRLSEIEINSIVEDYEIRKKEESIIENYKNSCPNFKNGKCAGSVNLDSRFGCNLCIKKGIYDLKKNSTYISIFPCEECILTLTGVEYPLNHDRRKD